MAKKKAFGLWSAVFLGLGSMVGAGIFIVIGQAGAIAGNIVWISFFFGGILALLSGYSLAKLAIRYPSRGGIIEYLVQAYGEGIFSGAAGVLFYLSQLIAIAAVAKSFGVYAATFMHGGNHELWANIYSIGVVVLFALINLIGAAIVAKSENIIVIIKLTILIVFAIIAFFSINPKLLSTASMPPLNNMLFAIGITFFAYQGFSVITNTVEDMSKPEKNMLKAMLISILMVAGLYIITSIAVLGNLPLSKVIAAKDYALAEAAKPILGAIGFKVIAATALLATASAINASLFATTEIGYTLAKEGDLPTVYDRNIFHSYEGLIVSTLIVIPILLFFNLSQITTVAALAVLIIQGLTHIGHLFKIKETGARLWLILLAVVVTLSVIILTIIYTSKNLPNLIYYILGAFVLSVLFELVLRLFNGRTIRKQSTVFIEKMESELK
jgi:amino acid transporter